MEPSLLAPPRRTRRSSAAPPSSLGWIALGLLVGITLTAAAFAALRLSRAPLDLSQSGRGVRPLAGGFVTGAPTAEPPLLPLRVALDPLPIGSVWPGPDGAGTGEGGGAAPGADGAAAATGGGALAPADSGGAARSTEVVAPGGARREGGPAATRPSSAAGRPTLRTTGAATLRAQASSTSPALATLDGGTVVEALPTDALALGWGWRRVQAGGVVGYLPNSLLR